MPNTVVIFGASGDLTSRKLIPALYLLHQKGRLPEETKVVGVSRSQMSSEDWRKSLGETTRKFAGKEFDEASWKRFVDLVYYEPGDIDSHESFVRLHAKLKELEGGQKSSRLYYLSTKPELYATAIEQLGLAGMAQEDNGPRRVIIEKPFGTDLPTAQALNQVVHHTFEEHQVFRIDHYLGKETVQNLLVLRFANSIFEPIWNRNFIDHVQITVAEEVDVAERAGYYDTSGVMRDMFQNHILQLVMITAMEAPVRYQADAVRDEKVKVLRAVRPMAGAEISNDTLRGQYEGYSAHRGVPKGSDNATFMALKLQIDNWRWNGVPFYIRSGKAMSCRTTQIVIQFREPPFMLFGDRPRSHLDANRLVIQIQPAEGIQLLMQSKVPDQGMKMQETSLDFRFARNFQGTMPDGYQRLLLDAMNGDASLFARSDEVVAAWKIVDPILAAWKTAAAPPLHIYPVGDWGPTASTEWMRAQGREWFDVCPVLH